MPPSVRRFIPLLLGLAPLPAFADAAHDLPTCPAFDAAPADWARAQERGFTFVLPPGAHAQPRGPALDHEFGLWTFDHGGVLQFQYGFAVTELASWLEEKYVTGCRASLDGVDAVLLERRDPNGTFAWAIGLFDYVHSYTTSETLYEGNDPSANDFTLIGSGPSEAVFAQGRAVFESFRWSRLPASSLAAWSVEGAANNGVLMFETQRGAAGLMLATYREGRPHWLVGSTPGPVMSYRLDDAVSVPLVLYETANGVSPGQTDHPADVTPYADAEFTVSLADGCTRAQLRWQPRNRDAPTTLHLRPTYPLLHGCSNYGR
jgi:hypothetical protein